MYQEGTQPGQYLVFFFLLFIAVIAGGLIMLFIPNIETLSAAEPLEDTAGQLPQFELIAENEVLYRDVAYQAFVAGDYEQAVQYYGYAISLNAQDSSLYLSRASAYTELNMLPLAAVDLEQSLRLNPQIADMSTYFFNLGNRAFDLQLFEQAVTYFSRAVELAPSNPQNYYLLARTYEHMSDIQRANVYYEYVISISPELGYGIVVGRGVTAHNNQDYPAALQQFERAIQLQPQTIDAYRYRVMTYHALGDRSAALNDILRTLEIAPANPQAYRDLAWYYEQEGDLYMANVYHQRAAELQS